MLYLIALFIPPLGIALSGRVILAVIVGVLWIASVLLTWGFSHILFVILAWVLIGQRRADKRHRETIKALRDRNDG